MTLEEAKEKARQNAHLTNASWYIFTEDHETYFINMEVARKSGELVYAVNPENV